MPKPTDVRTAYLPGLDGLRAIAVALVIAYHIDIPGFSGGMLGVGVFFTLSGFIITTVLVRTWQKRGNLALSNFWIRRARRLLPAVFLLLLSTLAATALFDPEKLSARIQEAGWAAIYVANWATVMRGESYFDRFQNPSPFSHLWSLSIEEQFYLFWPLLLLILFTLLTLIFRRTANTTNFPTDPSNLGRIPPTVLPGSHPGYSEKPYFQSHFQTDPRTPAARALTPSELVNIDHTQPLPISPPAPPIIPSQSAGTAAAISTPRQRKVFLSSALIVTLLGAISFWWLYQQYLPHADNTRAYEGTDTRAGALLWGAALALLWRPEHWQKSAGINQKTFLDMIGFLGLGGIIFLSLTTSETSASIYSWGILSLTLATCAALIAIAQNGTLIARFLGTAPFRWVGERSYGIYLWHMPIISFTTTLTPDQHFALGYVSPGWGYLTHPFTIACLQIILTLLFAALSWKYVEEPIRTHGLIAAWRIGRTAKNPLSKKRLLPPMVPIALIIGSLATGSMGLVHALPKPTLEQQIAAQERQENVAGHASGRNSTAPVVIDPENLRTSCREVIYIGDSTSVGMNSAEVLPNPQQRIKGRLQEFGAKETIIDIDGARSIVERYKGHPNGEDVARSHQHFSGCWIIALGLNDAATFGLGQGGATPQYRIETMMSLIPADAQVLWVNSITMPWANPTYGNRHMQVWNRALNENAQNYPNLRIYDWNKQVRNWTVAQKQSFFQNDGVHYSADGYAVRAKGISMALAMAFPEGGEPLKNKWILLPNIPADKPSDSSTSPPAATHTSTL